jgi:hypothetical protein
MAVVEYKMHIVGPQGQYQQPHFIREGGHFQSTDHSRVGWIVDNAEYYIPDTLTTLTKAQLVTRQLALHSANPERIYTDDTDNWRDKTDAEVTSETEAWYDAYVSDCASITK